MAYQKLIWKGCHFKVLFIYNHNIIAIMLVEICIVILRHEFLQAFRPKSGYNQTKLSTVERVAGTGKEHNA